MAAATEISSLVTRISPSGPRASGVARKEAAERALSCSRTLCPSSAPLANSAAPSPQRRRDVVVRSVWTADAGQNVAAAAGSSDLERVKLSNGKLAAAGPRRKTKIVCTIGPSTNTKEMIWKLAEAGMNVARLNMSHGDHASHQRTIDLVKEYNAHSKDNVVAIMLDTKGPEVRSGDVPQPILLEEGQEFNFTIKRGVSFENTVSVNYDDFVNDVENGDILLVDGGMMSLAVKSKTSDTVKCEVIDGGELKSRRHLNVRGKSATLPSITDKDWEDIKFGVDNKVDFYAVSFVKDAKVIYELKDYLKSCNADIHIIPKIESADSIPNLQSIISASDGRHKGVADPLEVVAGEISDESILLCLDEFMVLVATSNRAPDHLYEGGLQRDLFLPFIETLKERCIVHAIGSSTDYRKMTSACSFSVVHLLSYLLCKLDHFGS